MKKRALSFLKSKTRPRSRQGSTAKRRSPHPSAKKLVRGGSFPLKRAALEPRAPILRIAPADDIVSAVAPSASSQVALPKINLQLQDTSDLESAAPAWVQPAYQSQPSSKSQRRLAMWAGVIACMVLIVGGWVWTLRYTISVPAGVSDNALPLRQTEDGLTDLFQEVNKSLNQLQSPPSLQPDSAKPNLRPLQELNAAEIELLKKKLEEQAPSQGQPSGGQEGQEQKAAP